MAARRSPEERNRYAAMIGLTYGADGVLDAQEETLRPRSVYFVHAKTARTVKIGITYDVAGRLKNLQSSCPIPLELARVIENASLETEKELHERFAAHRLHGEWFSEEVLKLL